MATSHRSVMAHNFSQVPTVDIPRSSFNRSHGLKTTFNAGLLIPILVDEALPGDTFNLSMTGFARLATPLKPVMDNMFMETFFFAVPNRLVWDNWQKFNGEQNKPGDSTDFVIPYTAPGTNGYATQTIMDYMGLPTGVGDYRHSSLFGRAYNFIWNEWFRDQNLQEPAAYNTGDGPDSRETFKLLRRGKRHDYFTSALPWPQKGDPVTIPTLTQAPVIGTGTSVPNFGVVGGNATFNLQRGNITDPAPNTVNIGPGAADGAANNSLYWKNTSLIADLSAATAITINDLREGFQIQRMFERDARGGTRYTEILRSHFGVNSPDQRLQRPEYLGGGSSPISLTPIAQTNATQSEQGITPQGNLSAIGTTVLKNHGFSKSFTEHCLIIGLINVRADLTYQQGLNRMHARQTRYDFYWPSLSHLGEQAILNQEIFMQPMDTVDDPNTKAFGYQERYAEYRYKPSQITGKFRSTDAQTLDVWHLSQKFDNLPTLSAEFIEDKPPIERIIAVNTEPHFLFDAYFQYKCARPMPIYGVPGLIDHF